MKNKTLLPLSDFVLKQSNENIHPEEFYSRVVGYTEFLKRALNIEMFFASDENGIFFKEPERYEEFIYSTKFDSFTEKEKEECFSYSFYARNILFKGFKKITGSYTDMHGSGVNVLIDGIDFPIQLDETKTIESLVEYGLTLTHSALQQIGIEE